MKITFANGHTTSDGKAHKAGATVEVENVEARTLIHKGKAVEASQASARKKTATADSTSSAAAETTTTPARGKGKD